MVTPTWASGPLRLGRSHRARRIGLLPAPGPFGVLLPCAAVHTVGMTTAIGVVALDDSGLVLAAVAVPPGRMRRWRRAVWIVETAPSAGLPVVGERAALRPILARWPAP